MNIMLWALLWTTLTLTMVVLVWFKTMASAIDWYWSVVYKCNGVDIFCLNMFDRVVSYQTRYHQNSNINFALQTGHDDTYEQDMPVSKDKN